MIHRDGDLFTTNAKIIAHGANTKGVMGAGIAHTVRKKFPKNYAGYVSHCNSGLAQPGEWYGNNQDDNDILVLNLYSQDKPGANARYEWVYSSIMDFFRLYSNYLPVFGTTVAIPEIGSGIGGLEWPKVRMLLDAAEVIYPEFEFEVWHYEG